MEVVCFHLICEPCAYLSNWYPVSFEDAGIRYACAEQHIMRQKALMFGDDKVAEQIMATDDPAEMKDLGRKVANFDKDVWLGNVWLVGYRAVMAKFRDNALLRERLLATGDAVLAECAWKDDLWGIALGMNAPERLHPAQWKGDGMLGRILMIVREQLRETHGDQERMTPLLNAFARRMALAAGTAGAPGIIASITNEEMRRFGLEMDGARSFELMYGPNLGDTDMFELAKDRIDDPFILASALYSEWRYFTQVHLHNMSEDNVKWFKLAAERLQELTA